MNLFALFPDQEINGQNLIADVILITESYSNDKDNVGHKNSSISTKTSDDIGEIHIGNG